MIEIEVIKKQIKKRSDRMRKTIYISDALYSEARRAFNGVSMSKVIEELLREALGKTAA